MTGKDPNSLALCMLYVSSIFWFCSDPKIENILTMMWFHNSSISTRMESSKLEDDVSNYEDDFPFNVSVLSDFSSFPLIYVVYFLFHSDSPPILHPVFATRYKPSSSFSFCFINHS